MFYKKKIEALQQAHLRDMHTLQAENEALQNKIDLLEKDLKTRELAIEKTELKGDMLELTLNSYSDGMNFLQNAIDDNLSMLSGINTLNEKTVTLIDDLSSQTTQISSSIESIQGYTHRLNDNSASLNESVKSINDIINLIKGISDQTNLLALNAAIEAARAGEHGRGFAVVSDEVRKLALHTQNATQEVEVNINALKESSKSMTEISQIFTNESSTIMANVSTFANSLTEISNYSHDITSKTVHVTNSTSISIGKIDHICLKIEGYNSFLDKNNRNIIGHNSCRFGQWFNSAAKTILSDKQLDINTIATEHKKVHSGLQAAVSIFTDATQDNHKGIEIMREVEVASKKSFELLLSLVKKSITR